MGFDLKNVDGWPCYHVPEFEQAGLVHGFMTRTSDAIVHDMAKRARFVQALGGTRAVILKQEHGTEVHLIAAGEEPATGDGLVLSEPGVIGVVKTADCVPVILCEPQRPLAAVVHAGWRGTAARITAKAVATMIAAGARPGAISALIGPAIGPCCYTVGDDVVSVFEKAGFQAHIFRERDGRIFLDLAGANRAVLHESGVDDVRDVNLCTRCSGTQFYSARREGNGGRQFSFVLLPRMTV